MTNYTLRMCIVRAHVRVETRMCEKGFSMYEMCIIVRHVRQLTMSSHSNCHKDKKLITLNKNMSSNSIK